MKVYIVTTWDNDEQQTPVTMGVYTNRDRAFNLAANWFEENTRGYDLDDDDLGVCINEEEGIFYLNEDGYIIEAEVIEQEIIEC